MTHVLKTSSVEPRHRLAYWSEMVCETYVQLECDPIAGERSIAGEIASDRLATLELSCVTATAQRVHRTPARIARTGEDYLLVSIQAQGEGKVIQHGRTAQLQPGDFALYDSTCPYELRFDGPFRQYVLMIPGPLLRTALNDTHRLTATTVSGQRGAGHLMIGMISTLAADMPTLAPESSAAVADSITNILVAGLSGLPAARPVPVSQLAALHREQIKACVRARLSEPALTIASIAAQLRLSPSTLHRAWAGEPCSLGDWIWNQRLDAAQRELVSPAHAKRSVSEIAFAWGFSDAAHFSRAFRARFGCSPRELRASTRRSG